MTGTARGVFTDDLVLTALTLPSMTPPALGIAKVSQSITPAAVAAATTVEQSFTIPGVLPGDSIDVNPPALTAGVVLSNARVSAANTVQIQFTNSTAGSLTPPAGVHIFIVVR
ncbi:MAG TPA: hypothetical protein PLI96_08015 [Halothiobacillus sp.]|nr:hypothetical protein [Halothiobacillus sp.]